MFYDIYNRVCIQGCGFKFLTKETAQRPADTLQNWFCHWRLQTVADWNGYNATAVVKIGKAFWDHTCRHKQVALLACFNTIAYPF